MRISNGFSHFTQDGFTISDDGNVQEIKYGDLARVTIETTDQGPWLPDCFWILETEAGLEVVIENGDPVATFLLPALQRALPGLDNDAVIKAMASTDYATFQVWQKTS